MMVMEKMIVMVSGDRDNDNDASGDDVGVPR